MTDRLKSLPLILPYAVWMVLMTVLPATAGAYAVRSAATAVLLVWSFVKLGRAGVPSSALPKITLAGLIAGLAVFFIWIAPEELLFARAATAAADSPFHPAVCGWPLTLVRLAGSALVIPIAEELFFRQWLVDFAGFWWMVALFAVEHGERWHVGAITGVIYGLLAKRLGLGAAIVAHIVTNLALGLYVVRFNAWHFW